MRSRANVIRTTQRQIKIPVVDQTGATVGQPTFFGGLEVSRRSLGPLSSDAKFRQAEISVRELIGYTVFSNSLLADSDPSLADFLSGPLGFPGAIAWKEDYAFIRGNGVGEPLGLVNAPATRLCPARPADHQGMTIWSPWKLGSLALTRSGSRRRRRRRR